MMYPRLPGQPPSFRPAHMVQRRLRTLGFAKKHAWLTSNLGRELGAIAYEALAPCGEPVTSAGGFELLCSYNWRRGKKRARIFVPGEAPRIVPHKLPHVARVQSKGINYRDVNAAYMPRRPFEPMLRAVGVMRAEFRFDEVDLVINRSSLHHLLRLADGGRCKGAFRLDLAMVNATLIVTPLWETVYDKGNYGRVFEQAFTQHPAKMRESQSHHRAILYSLGPLKVVVLCEVDASFSGLRPSWTLRNWTLGPTTPELLEEVEAIKKASYAQTELEQTLFATIDKGQFASTGSSLLEHLGQGTLSANAAEMVTMKAFSTKSKIPQMWLGRTPYLIMSTHVKNTFTGVQAAHCGPHLRQFEVERQSALKKLVTAIKTLKDFTVNSPSRHGIAVCTKDVRTLRVFEPTDEPESPVPKAVISRFWRTPLVSDLGETKVGSELSDRTPAQIAPESTYTKEASDRARHLKPAPMIRSHQTMEQQQRETGA